MKWKLSGYHSIKSVCPSALGMSWWSSERVGRFDEVSIGIGLVLLGVFILIGLVLLGIFIGMSRMADRKWMRIGKLHIAVGKWFDNRSITEMWRYYNIREESSFQKSGRFIKGEETKNQKCDVENTVVRLLKCMCLHIFNIWLGANLCENLWFGYGQTSLKRDRDWWRAHVAVHSGCFLTLPTCTTTTLWTSEWRKMKIGWQLVNTIPIDGRLCCTRRRQRKMSRRMNWSAMDFMRH